MCRTHTNTKTRITSTSVYLFPHTCTHCRRPCPSKCHTDQMCRTNTQTNPWMTFKHHLFLWQAMSIEVSYRPNVLHTHSHKFIQSHSQAYIHFHTLFHILSGHVHRSITQTKCAARTLKQKHESHSQACIYFHTHVHILAGHVHRSVIQTKCAAQTPKQTHKWHSNTICFFGRPCPSKCQTDQMCCTHTQIHGSHSQAYIHFHTLFSRFVRPCPSKSHTDPIRRHHNLAVLNICRFYGHHRGGGGVTPKVTRLGKVGWQVVEILHLFWCNFCLACWFCL